MRKILIIFFFTKEKLQDTVPEAGKSIVPNESQSDFIKRLERDNKFHLDLTTNPVEKSFLLHMIAY